MSADSSEPGDSSDTESLSTDEGLGQDVCETRGLVEQNGTVYAAVPAEVVDDLDLEHKGRAVWTGREGDDGVTLRSNDDVVSSLADD